MNLNLRLAAACIAFGAAISPAAGAADLRIGIAAEPTSLDPYYHNAWNNVTMDFHLFDPLVRQDAQEKLQPGLATSWKAVDDTTWEFTLRHGVKFQDGGAFTADDVAFSLERIPKVPNSPSSFVIYTSTIASWEIPQPDTIRVHTKEPDPNLPTKFSLFGIMGRAQSSGPAPEGRSSAELSSGTGLVGTGPYRFVSWKRGDSIVMERNPTYWGGIEPWSQVSFRPISTGTARTAAVLAGDIDVAENVPAEQLAMLRGDARVALWASPTNQVMYIAMDSFRDRSPGISDAASNPLKDPRVRRALSIGIDRTALVDRLLAGAAVPAAEVAPSFMFGTDPTRKVEAYDPGEARRLLTEAGYPNGFRLVLGTASDRYQSITQLAQAIGAMWTRIGVRTEIDGSPFSAFVGKRNRFEYSAFIGGSQVYTGEMGIMLNYLVMTPNAETGDGVLNKGRYSSPALDALLNRAARTIDDTTRLDLLHQASRLAIDDHAVLPLYVSVNTTATRVDLVCEPRVDTGVPAMSIRPKPSP